MARFLSRVGTFFRSVCIRIFCNGCGLPRGPLISRGKEFEEKIGVFLPNILDEITLKHIVPMLSWRDFYFLSAVSPAWRYAIRSGLVHHVQGQSHLAEPLVPLICNRSTIALYSTRGNSWFQLPPIPKTGDVLGEPSETSQMIFTKCVSLDGKIYVLRKSKSFGRSSEQNIQFYVFDLARQGKWEQLASMTQERLAFACDIYAKDGKIHVFGCTTVEQQWRSQADFLAYESEVYDPEENSWSLVKPMTRGGARFCHTLRAVGAAPLFVFGGIGYGILVESWYRYGFGHPIMSLGAYHPDEDEWRVVDSFWRNRNYIAFTAQGKLYSTRKSWSWNCLQSIHTYDVNLRSWRLSHSFSLGAILPHSEQPTSDGLGIVALEDELLAIVHWKTLEQTRVVCLLQSEGFSEPSTEITWQLKSPSTRGLSKFRDFDLHSTGVYRL